MEVFHTFVAVPTKKKKRSGQKQVYLVRLGPKTGIY